MNKPARGAIWVIGLILLAVLSACPSRSSSDAGGRTGGDSLQSAQASPVIRVASDENALGLSFLSWDTEGGNKVDTNLLRTGGALPAGSAASAGNDLGAVAYVRSGSAVHAATGVRIQSLADGPGGRAWEDATVVNKRAESRGGAIVFELDAGGARLEWRVECANAPDQNGATNLDSAKSAEGPVKKTLDSAALPPGSLQMTFSWLDGFLPRPDIDSTRI
jgi:hypothetical protein